MQTCYEVLTDSHSSTVAVKLLKKLSLTKESENIICGDVLDAQFYILRTGTQWRNIPDYYPPWETVYYYFRK